MANASSLYEQLKIAARELGEIQRRRSIALEQTAMLEAAAHVLESRDLSAEDQRGTARQDAVLSVPLD